MIVDVADFLEDVDDLFHVLMHLLEGLVGGVEVTNHGGGEEEFLEKEISARLHKKEASHSVVPPMSSEEIFLRWPDTFKMIFATQMSVLGTELRDGIDDYESCGYSFPQSFFQWASSFES